MPAKPSRLDENISQPKVDVTIAELITIGVMRYTHTDAAKA